ncbi:PREDICTED: POPTR_0014s10080g [Prunus dulcis]|uniref:PREDICTED: POPTR_0014s10080g n=1 Tax=Prunus dulcis TaxID=3755 RepID=A0A5E4FCI7_PRUDU|nr:PREDICTED: POPTR_0014s10080g [Prunus dulcis]
MGNWVGRYKDLVHPSEDHKEIRHRTSPNSLTVKVRMTTTQLKELMAQVDMMNMAKDRNSEELGRVILQECLEGRLTAGIVAAAAENHGDQVSKYARGNWMLSTICEGKEEQHEHSL